MARDVGSLAVPWLAIQAVAVTVGMSLIGRHGNGPTQSLDDSVHRWFIAHRAGLVGISLVIAVLGDAPALGVIAVAATILLVVVTRDRRHLAIAFAYLGAEATVFVVRQFVFRPRPLSANHPGPGALSGVHETSWSFPSGHATSVTAVVVAGAFLLSHRRRSSWPWITAIALSVAVAASRLVLGVHWCTDVTIGLALGAVWGIVVGRHFTDSPGRRRVPVEGHVGGGGLALEEVAHPHMAGPDRTGRRIDQSILLGAPAERL